MGRSPTQGRSGGSRPKADLAATRRARFRQEAVLCRSRPRGNEEYSRMGSPWNDHTTRAELACDRTSGTYSDQSFLDLGRGDGAGAAVVRIRTAERLPDDAPGVRGAPETAAGRPAHTDRDDDWQRAARPAVRRAPGLDSRQPLAAAGTCRADVARVTGLPTETVRRHVESMVKRGILEAKPKGVHAPNRLKERWLAGATLRLIESHAACTERLIALGVLAPRPSRPHHSKRT